MTVPPSLDYRTMDFSSLEDKMDLASSPFPHIEEVEDLEFEFDQMDNRPPDPASDNIMDDANEQEKVHEETADGRDVEFFEDQDITDTTNQDSGNEFDMDEVARERQDDDEEILYEEEDESTVMANKAEIENDQYLRNPEHGTDDFLEPDEIVGRAHVASNAEQNNTDIHFDNTNHHDTSSRLQDNPQLKPSQYDGTNVVDDIQTTRDDGDGPTIEPIETEFEEDPDADADQLQQPTEAGILVQDPSEEAFDAEESISVFPSDPTSGEVPLLPLSSTEATSEATVEKESDVVDSALALEQDLHSVRVNYQGVEYALFPPRGEDSTSYFLQDSTLATQPLGVLLSSCRDVLGKPQDLDEHDELVLDMPSMGLHICEDSKYASQIKLSDIVEVYVSLNHNEHREVVEPLYCNLSTRVCLSTQFNWLRDQAKTGVTFSEIAVQHMDSPADENESTDTAHAQEDLGGQAHDADDTTTKAGSEVAPVLEDPFYPTDERVQDDQALQLDDEGLTSGFPDASDALEGSATEDVGRTHEGLPFETGDVKPSDEGPNTVLDSSLYHDPQAEIVASEAGADVEVSEFFQEAIDEQIEEEGEEAQETAEDNPVLQDAFAQEQIEDQSLLAEEAAHNDPTEIQNDYDADEFLIPSDDELTADTDTGDGGDNVAEAAESLAPAINGKHANGEQLHIESSESSKISPSTPSKKTSKRKVSEEEDDLVLELDTPEPKRRRPS